MILFWIEMIDTKTKLIAKRFCGVHVSYVCNTCMCLCVCMFVCVCVCVCV